MLCLVLLNTDESLGSEGEKEDTSAHTCYPHLKACGKESSVSYEVKRQQRVTSVEKCSEEPGCPTLYGQSSSSREGRQRHMLVDCDEKPKISCVYEKAPGNVTVDQCNNTGEKSLSCPVRETPTGHKRNLNSHQTAHAEDGCYAPDQSLDVKQSTSLPTEAELHETKRSAPCQTVCRRTFCLILFLSNSDFIWSFNGLKFRYSLFSCHPCL